MLHLAPRFSSPYTHFPQIPSPLSPRSANIYGGRQSHDYMSSNTKPQPSTSDATCMSTGMNTKRHLPYSQRAVKKAPCPKQEELTNRRRNQFLQKVRDQRDSRRHEARGDDIMRLEFMQRQRAYERDLALSAPQSIFEDEEDEEEAELPGWSQNENHMVFLSQQEEAEADEFARKEDEEVRALLEYMPDDGKDPEDRDERESLWSDDADYDALFLELLEKEQEREGMEDLQQQQQQQQQQQVDGEEMDMS